MEKMKNPMLPFTHWFQTRCEHHSSRPQKKRLGTAMHIAAAAGLLCMTIPAFAQTAATHAAKPANEAQIHRGEYLVKGVAGCADCHTPRNNRGEPVEAEWLKGTTLQFAPLKPFPGWAGASPDIAGLHGWTNEQAIRFLMTGLNPGGQRARSPMPQYRMNHADAAAVVAYLKSLK